MKKIFVYVFILTVFSINSLETKTAVYRKLKPTKKRGRQAAGNKFYLSNKKDGPLVFHRATDIIASFNYYPADIYAKYTMPPLVLVLDA